MVCTWYKSTSGQKRSEGIKCLENWHEKSAKWQFTQKGYEKVNQLNSEENCEFVTIPALPHNEGFSLLYLAITEVHPHERGVNFYAMTHDRENDSWLGTSALSLLDERHFVWERCQWPGLLKYLGWIAGWIPPITFYLVCCVSAHFLCSV